jgi:hypothetical protein
MAHTQEFDAWTLADLLEGVVGTDYGHCGGSERHRFEFAVARALDLPDVSLFAHLVQVH